MNPNITEKEYLYGKCILYAEDNEIVSSVTSKVLKKYDVDVKHAVDGQQAIDLYLQHANDIDLIILDVMMPKKNGFEVAEQIFRHNENAKILICSGYYQANDEEVRVFSKMKGFLQKPYTYQKFVKTLNEILMED